MDIAQTLEQLYAEKQRLERAIAALQQLQAPQIAPDSGNRRGRKSMGAKEREEVSQRMTKYWANRRKTRTTG